MTDFTALAALVAAGDEVPGTTLPTGRRTDRWAEFYEAIPGAGFLFWATPAVAGDSIPYYVVDTALADPTDVELDADVSGL